MPGDDGAETLIIGLSGPSSSGKTTLARLLRGIFNIEASPSTNSVSIRLFILHEDDFYKTDIDIPERTVTSAEHGTRTLQDWDCGESLDLPLLATTLTHVSAHGQLPEDMHSKEDQNSVGDAPVPESLVGELHEVVLHRLVSGEPTTPKINICILDGFLLYPPPGSTRPAHCELHDLVARTCRLKLFLPSGRARTVKRRAARAGYVTLEGFWTDPPGYVEDVVWVNYREDHTWMFSAEGDDVDEGVLGRGGREVLREESGILVGPGSGAGVEAGMEEVVRWGVDVVWDRVAEILKGGTEAKETAG